jgi:mannose-1-phosphate guanylyltransferase
MYAVIMAGGGGTRLHPLSRPERPKPFLPLLGTESLLQRTAVRLLDGPELGLAPGDITVVTDRRYESLVRAQLPGVGVLLEPMGRNTAAAIALATLAIDRPDDEVMVVVPADAHIDPGRDGVYRAVLAAAGRRIATGALGIDDPLVTLGVQVERPSTVYGYLIPDLASRDRVEGLDVYRVARFEEKPTTDRADELVREPGVAWNAGIFIWRRGAIRAALGRHTGLLQTLGPMLGSPTALETAYEAIQRPLSIDHAVMEGAASRGQVVMATMDVGWSDLGGWTALLGALGIDATGAVVQTGETVEVTTDDLVIRRSGGRVGAIAPPEPGRMTAAQPIAVLRGVRPHARTIDALLARCSETEG